MEEVNLNDPGIKLFGKKIAVISGHDSDDIAIQRDDTSDQASRTCLEDDKVNGNEEEAQEAEKNYVHEQSEPRPQDKATHPITEESKESPESYESPRTPSIDEEAATLKPPKTENDQGDTTNSQQKTLKKPDKILPCPRCNSMDTKFCYYNNYNVNQPRHFCKSCQRYWTAGGTMRNVPVGAGRRKNKNSDSQCHHITISEALHAARFDAPYKIHNPKLQNNRTVLSFGSDSPLCESIPCVITLPEKKVPNTTNNTIYKLEQGVSVSCKGGEYGDDGSSGSSITTLNSNMDGKKIVANEPKLQNINGFPSQVPFLPRLPWPYPWNSAVPVPAICPSGFPYYPTPYWSCDVPGSWTIPWLSPPSLVTNQTTPGYDPKSPILGKHSREGDLLKPSNVENKKPFGQNHSERSVLVPKALRISDPDEAAKSSIWATLGIKNDSISREGLFKAFQPKKDEKSHVIKPSPVLQANPAALSRSLSFQERA